MVQSKALPFLEAPKKLDGSMVGDFGFDPMGLTDQVNWGGEVGLFKDGVSRRFDSYALPPSLPPNTTHAIINRWPTSSTCAPRS